MRLLLLVFLAVPALAQAPTEVWITAAPGALIAASGDSYESLYGSVAVQGARGSWTARLSHSESAVFRVGGSPIYSQTGPTDDPAVFRTLLLAAGPRVTSGATSAAVQLGPSWTRGQRRDGQSYADLGVGGAAQAMLQLGGGAVWLGTEVSGVLNGSSSHVGIGGLLRIDLVRGSR